jgi:nicotinate-nucleotide pyrophosphorylase (carboxylating)
MPLPATFDLMDFISRVLAEDLGRGGDVTSSATIDPDARFTAQMNARQDIVVAGVQIAAAFFRRLDVSVSIEQLAGDGDAVDAGAVLMRLGGNARAMLAAERSALNTLQHLSGVATLTRRYVDAIAGTGAVLLDTRKTIPGLRVLEKYATRMGGAQNHRMRLDDGVLIKDNHVAVCGGVAEAVRRAKAANTSSRSIAWNKSNRRSQPGPTACCSTTCRRPSCARRLRSSPDVCRLRRRAE